MFGSLGCDYANTEAFGKVSGWRVRRPFSFAEVSG